MTVWLICSTFVFLTLNNLKPSSMFHTLRLILHPAGWGGASTDSPASDGHWEPAVTELKCMTRLKEGKGHPVHLHLHAIEYAISACSNLIFSGKLAIFIHISNILLGMQVFNVSTAQWFKYCNLNFFIKSALWAIFITGQCFCCSVLSAWGNKKIEELWGLKGEPTWPHTHYCNNVM